jgi:hypothetical protein
MHLTQGMKRLSKWSLILLVISVSVILLLRSIVVYNLKDTLSAFVYRETEGRYNFDAASIKLSFIKKRIELNDATLNSRATDPVKSTYDVMIHKIYFEIGSWPSLIFKQKLVVEKLSITNPKIVIHGYIKKKETHAANHPIRIVEALRKLLVHLEVKAFTLENGSFEYHHNDKRKILVGSDIDLHIHDFSHSAETGKHLLYADDIDLTVGPQHYYLLDGIHEVRFKKLHFSAKNQYFELDSFAFYNNRETDQKPISITADKLYFNSNDLNQIYLNEQFLLDTLICVSPKVKFSPGDKKQGDNTRGINGLLKKINAKFVDIRDGGVNILNEQGHKASYESEHSNLKIFNLTFEPKKANPLQVDSVLIDLENLHFYSQDSLFRLAAKNILFKGNNVYFNGVNYGPYKHKEIFGNQLNFQAPSMLLENVRLDELLAKKIRATKAILFTPRIHINKQTITKVDETDTLRPTNEQAYVRFYRTLHSLQNMIGVEELQIKDGYMEANIKGKKDIRITIEKLNTQILPVKFLSSDSLVDIKHAIPILRMKRIHLHSNEMDLSAENYTFLGRERHNYLRSFELGLKSGTRAKGKNIYWEVFDWDLFQKFHLIQFNKLRIGDLELAIHPNPKHNINRSHLANLPNIHIWDLRVNNINISQINKDASFKLFGQYLQMDSIRSKEHYFTWSAMSGQFHDARYKNKSMNAEVKSILVEKRQVKIKETKIHVDGSKRIDSEIPELDFSPIYSTNNQNLSIDWIRIRSPKITWIQQTDEKRKKGTSKSFQLPVGFSLNKADIQNASFFYANKFHGMDTLCTTIDFSMEGIHHVVGRNEAVKARSVQAHLQKTNVKKRGLKVLVSELTVGLKDLRLENLNKKPLLSGNVDFLMRGGNVELQKTDSTGFALANLNLKLKYDSLNFLDLKKDDAIRLAFHTDMQASQFGYKGAKSVMQFNGANWTGHKGMLLLDSLHIKPTMTEEAVFGGAKYQTDYLDVKLANISMSGIKYDSPIYSSKLLQVGQLHVYAARDSRLPHPPFREKLMPTKMIQKIPVPISIDTIRIQEGNVLVSQFSQITGKKANIPLQNLKASILHFTSKPNRSDSLLLQAELSLLGNTVENFRYSESYTDSLSTFTAQMAMQPKGLVNLGNITKPLAAIAVTKGEGDTVFSNWKGNKYGAIGRMNFHYRNLGVRILNKNNLDKQSLLLNVENFVANLILRKNNDKRSMLFFKRFMDRSVFNYWVKSSLQGVLASVGLKSDKKYLKQYKKMKRTYPLPDYD